MMRINAAPLNNIVPETVAISLPFVSRPIESLADVEGQKMRVQPSGLFVAMMEALDANATPMPYGEVCTGLKTGIVDGAENNGLSYESSRHHEAAKHCNTTQHSMKKPFVDAMAPV